MGHEPFLVAGRVGEPDRRAAPDVAVDWHGQRRMCRPGATRNDVETGPYLIGVVTKQCDVRSDARFGSHAVADHPVRVGGDRLADLARGGVGAAAQADDASRFDPFDNGRGSGIRREGRELRFFCA